jgi:hypothetical protein
LQDAYVAGGLLLVPTTTSVETTHRFSLAQAIERDLTDEVRQSVAYLAANRRRYPPMVSAGARLLLSLADKLAEATQSQELEHSARPLHAYYAIPLLAFIAKDIFRDYFAPDEKRPDALDLPFRDLLRQYVRLHCTPETILPISGRYEMFPFVYFSSYDLHGMRRRAFTEGTLLMSTEMNILNMLLARE